MVFFRAITLIANMVTVIKQAKNPRETIYINSTILSLTNEVEFQVRQAGNQISVSGENSFCNLLYGCKNNK